MGPRTILATLEVPGIPAPQGSKSRMPNGAILEGASTAQRQRHSDWRTAVAQVARETAADAPGSPYGSRTQPLRLTVTFRHPMPLGRSQRLRRVGTAPKTTTPDLDKLVRSTCDALTHGGLIRDDSYLTTIVANKVEVTGWTGAVITLTEEDT
jgi:crossover junction endodeoxyribonuclease RusA